MGADLYRSTFAEHKDVVTAEIGKRCPSWVSLVYALPFYFRDSYNDSSILWQLNLSWWRDVTPILDKYPDSNDGSPPEASAEILALIKSRPVPDWPDTDEGRYFREKYKQLIEFLTDVIARGESVGYSL